MLTKTPVTFEQISFNRHNIYLPQNLVFVWYKKCKQKLMTITNYNSFDETNTQPIKQFSPSILFNMCDK